MKVNLNTTDRIIRFLLFIVAMTLFLMEVVTGWFAYSLVIIGTIFLLTSLMSFCPIYRALGIQSSKKVSEDKK